MSPSEFEELKLRYRYVPETGKFYYVRDFWIYKAGDEAKGHLRSGYVRLAFKGKVYSAHRLAYLFMGEPEPIEVDHINRRRSDNRWANLRSVSRQENMQNKTAYRNKTTSRLAGVCFYKATKKWKAQIQVAGHKIGLGYFLTELEARDAYLKAKRELHPLWYGQESCSGRRTARESLGEMSAKDQAILSAMFPMRGQYAKH